MRRRRRARRPSLNACPRSTSPPRPWPARTSRPEPLAFDVPERDSAPTSVVGQEWDHGNLALRDVRLIAGERDFVEQHRRRNPGLSSLTWPGQDSDFAEAMAGWVS